MRCEYEKEFIRYLISLIFSNSDNNTVSISIKFREKEFFPYRKFLRFNFFDFLSTVGGLLGLFAGISFLSLIEIFYFFTLRIITNLIRLFKLKRNSKVRPFTKEPSQLNRR
jgi:hypothetical protein